MANENVVTADLKGGWSCVTAPLWQWDYGQVLEITGIDDLPSSFVAHCANRWDGSSQTVLGSNGRLSIPNDLLTSGEPVYVWIILTADGTDGETKYKITIPVNRRAAPTDYPTTAQQSAITQAINALNTAAANAAAEVAAELVDPTLAVSGKAADAAKTGEELGNLKSDLNDQIATLRSGVLVLANGKENLLMKYDFVRGTLHYGVINSDTYRVSSAEIMSYDRNITLSVLDGFRYAVHYFTNGTYSSETPLGTNDIFIPKEQQFKVTIARVSDSSSEFADISEFASKVVFETQEKTEQTDVVSSLNGMYNKIRFVDFFNIEQGSYNTTTGQIISPVTSANRCRSSGVYDCNVGDTFILDIKTGFQANVIYLDENQKAVGQSGFQKGRYIATLKGTKFVYLLGKVSNTNITPNDVKNCATMVYYNEQANYEMGSYNSTPIEYAQCIYNGIKIDDALTRNVRATLNDAGKQSHDGTAIYYDGKIFCIFCEYTSGTSGDAAVNDTATIVVKVYNTSGGLLHSAVVAKKNDVHSSLTQNGGAGSPNAYLVGNYIYILYTAKINSTYCEMVCKLDTSSYSLSDYSQVLVDGDVLDNTWIKNNTSWNPTTTEYTSAQANCTIATDGAYYYIGWVYGLLGNAGAIIFRTTDFVNWSIFYKYNGDTLPVYEMPLICSSGYLYFAVRPFYGINYAYGVIGKIKIEDATLVESTRYPNCSSRPAFFKYENVIYFFTNPTNRQSMSLVRINETKLRDSEVIANCVGYYNYPSFAVDESHYTIYVLRSDNNMELTYFVPRIYAVSEVQIKIKQVFDLVNNA